MILNSLNLQRINLATEANFKIKDIELINSMQTIEQQKQFNEDLDIIVNLYEVSEKNGGFFDEKELSEKWDEVSRRLALWSLWASYATPQRRGIFSKKEIPFEKKILLRELISPETEFYRSGALK